MTLYNKYRPRELDEMFGNEKIIPTLDRMLNDLEKCPQAFLVTGPTGCGKTTLGRIIANRLEISENDFIELDSAQFRGIDTIREIRKQSQYAPLESERRAWLLDECHKLSNDAQNALLKILEDTPSHVYFILCTTEPNKLINTIKGRCSPVTVAPLNEDDMSHLLRKITKEEEEKLPRMVYEQIVTDAQGHARNAINVLEQVLLVDPEERLEVAQRSAEEQSQAIELCRALVANRGWKSVQTILNGIRDQEPESVRRLVLGYCQSILLKKSDDRVARIMEEFLEPFYNTGFPGLVYACYAIVKT